MEHTMIIKGLVITILVIMSLETNMFLKSKTIAQLDWKHNYTTFSLRNILEKGESNLLLSLKKNLILFYKKWRYCFSHQCKKLTKWDSKFVYKLPCGRICLSSGRNRSERVYIIEPANKSYTLNFSGVNVVNTRNCEPTMMYIRDMELLKDSHNQIIFNDTKGDMIDILCQSPANELSQMNLITSHAVILIQWLIPYHSYQESPI